MTTVTTHRAPDFGAYVMAVERVERLLLRVTQALDAAGVPYAVIGGNAVAAWVSIVDSGATRATKDVDLLLRRADLNRAREVLSAIGLIYDEVLGVPVFMEADDPLPSRGVHVILASEKVRESAKYAAPGVELAERAASGFLVLDLASLVAMKLEANRRVDQVHIEDLLRVGLLDAALASKLPPDLLERLRYVRDTMEWFSKPPEF
jgi:hypothetical protein